MFTVAVTSAFALGLYSLFLASANADKVRPLNVAGVLRTATAADADKIEIALGELTEQDLVLVVLDRPGVGLDPVVEMAARTAAGALVDSGLAVAVRLLDPGHADFTTLVAQHAIHRFPAVLAVKKDGGIVLVTDDLSKENLLHTYYRIWGRTSSCDDAASAVY